MTEVAEVWCAECDQPSYAEFYVDKYPDAVCSLGTGRTDCTCCEHDGETVALCPKHIAARFPSELYPITESELRLMDGNR